VAHTYPELPDSVSRVFQTLQQRIAGLLAEEGTNLEAVERELVSGLAEVGLAVMREVLVGLDPGGEDVLVDGERHWEAIRAVKEYMCTFGRLTVERGLYRAVRNEATVCPMELRAGVVEGFWTPHAARLAALSISDMTPYRAESFFRELGMMRPSRSSLDRLPKLVSEKWESKRDSYEARVRAVEQVPSKAVTVAVSLDGVMVPTRSAVKAEKKAEMRSQGRADKGPAGYKEVACGTLSFYDADGERLATRRMARMPEPNKKTLKEQLRRELDHVLVERPDLAVVAVADGAHNNWDFLATLPCQYEVVDFFHAAQHLKRALDACMGPSTVATQEKFQLLRRKLLEHQSGADVVIRELRKLKPQKRGDHRDYRTGVNYFVRHRKRMAYAKLRAKCLPIGSGDIEGTCKSLASDRLKRAGMRWNEAGGQAVLNLRSWVQSDRFDAAWQLIRENYHAEIRPIPAAA